MHFTKLILILAISLAFYINFSEAGQAGSTAAKTAQKALNTAGKYAPKAVVAGYAANSTFNVNVNPTPGSRSSSPKGKKS